MHPQSIPSTQNLSSDQEVIFNFRRTLRRADQLVLDNLVDAAQKHLVIATYAGIPINLETQLLVMLLEEHKEVMRLKSRVENLFNLNQEGGLV